MTAICEVCEKPTEEPVTDAEEGTDFCGPCAVSLLGAERDRYKQALEAIAEGNVPNVTFADDDLISRFAREALEL